MKQNYSVIGKKLKACVRTAVFFDDEMDNFVHTAKRRGDFARLLRRKCSTVHAPFCALLLKPEQTRLRLNSIILGRRT